jgi:hypothetical protein
MRHHWINKADQEYGIQEIGLHLCSFGNRPGHNARQSAGKGELEKPTFKLEIVALQKKALVANKRLFARRVVIIVATVRKGKARGPKSQAAAARIEQVPQNYILDVLGANAASAQHGKARLHEVHESSGENEVKGVDTFPNTIRFVRR